MAKKAVSAIEALADWATNVSDQHTDLAYSRARNAVLDTVGCSLFGIDYGATVPISKAVAGWGDGVCTVIGAGRSASAPWAAMLNATSAHAQDFDDHEIVGMTHPSSVVVPGLLALAEERNLSGRNVLDAYIIGIEVIMRIGESVNMPFYHNGWHATSTIGAIGAAAACARLLRLDAAGMANAISLGTSMAAGCNSQVGTLAKATHAGLAAKAGVIAACLAEAGVTGQPTTLDAEWSSIQALYAGPKAKGFTEALTKIGNPLAIDEYGLFIKLFPCCSFLHRAIDAMLYLRENHNLTAGDVDKITVTIPVRNMDILDYPDPKSGMLARFSMHYCVAVALIYGQLTPSDFKEEALERSEVRALLPLIDFCGHPETAANDDPNNQDPDVVTVRLKDGSEYTRSVDHPRGSPEIPVSHAELLAKFNSCASRFEGDELTAATKALEEFDTLPTVSQLTRHLVFRATT